MTLLSSLGFLLACAAGGMCRFAVAGAIARGWGPGFPLGTLVVNLSGALLLGGLTGLLGGQGGLLAAEVRLILVTGFLGCYTTVSSFSLQTLSLIEEGQAARALVNVLASLGGCLVAVALGFAAGQAISGLLAP